MRLLLYSLLIISGFSIPFASSAQHKPGTDKPLADEFLDSLFGSKPSSYFKADINFLSNSVYNGRKDSLPVPYITPTFGYYHKSGLYADISESFLTSSYAVRPDLFIAEGGYNFTIGNNFSGSLNASKYFSSKQSISVQSEVRGTFDVNAAYTISNIVKASAGASYLFSSGKPDVLIDGGLSHEWDWGTDSDWSIEPSLTVNVGSQNYFDSYQQSRTRKTGKRKKNTTPQAGFSTDVHIVSLNPKRFVLLDYELSAPLYYDSKKWGAYFIPSFAIPQNPDTYNVTTTTVRTYRDGTTDTPVVRQFQVPENLENSFYAQVGVYFVIK